MKRFLFLLILFSILLEVTAHAAPIGVPGATAGANKSIVATEVNVLFDRDTTDLGSVKSLQVFAKGQIGLTDRVDLLMRLGLGDFDVDSPGIHTDIGPAFGVGFKTTWAAIPDANLKIGSVAQTTQLRAKDNDHRFSLTEYDLALGAYFDAPASRSVRAGDVIFLPYGGIVFSGMDVSGGPAEKNGFGLFGGLALKMGGNVHVGIELRLVDQTSLGLQAGVAF